MNNSNEIAGAAVRPRWLRVTENQRGAEVALPHGSGRHPIPSRAAKRVILAPTASPNWPGASLTGRPAFFAGT